MTRRVIRVYLVAFLISLAAVAGASAGSARRVDSQSLYGKFIFGYQGWFGCPMDVVGQGWRHWFSGTVPDVEMLPDVRELRPSERCPTDLFTKDGRRIEVYSSSSLAAVELHFAWMEKYGLDGVALQRFGTQLLQPELLKSIDIVLFNVRQAAEDHGRVFFVMYDLSHLPPDRILAVARDWERLEASGLTRDPAYLHHRGRPVLGLWGIGFADRPMQPGDAAALFAALRASSVDFGGLTLLGGVPTFWRTGDRDASADPGWRALWPQLEVISPWTVSRFGNELAADEYRSVTLAEDIKETRRLGVDYLPVIFPGASGGHTASRPNAPPTEAANEIPRRCGRFFWRQVYNALSSGALMMYGAMFDEVDEGTAIFKVVSSAADLPQGHWFLTLDADGCRLESDWYLRLAGAATASLRARRPPSPGLPLALPSN